MTGIDITDIDTDVVAVETHGRASLPPRQQPPPFPYRHPKSISSFVAGFKSAATKKNNEYRKTPGVPVWQPRFYDHIIRNNHDLVRIREYIINNPKQWARDDFHNNRGTIK